MPLRTRATRSESKGEDRNTYCSSIIFIPKKIYYAIKVPKGIYFM